MVTCIGPPKCIRHSEFAPDDSWRMTGNPEVIGSSAGLVPRNAPAVTDPFAGERQTLGLSARCPTGLLPNRRRYAQNILSLPTTPPTLRLRDCYHPLFFADAYSVAAKMGVWGRRRIRF